LRPELDDEAADVGKVRRAVGVHRGMGIFPNRGMGFQPMVSLLSDTSNLPRFE
jgi:hypothetical protein